MKTARGILRALSDGVTKGTTVVIFIESNMRNSHQRTYQGVPLSRSHVKRLENEVKALRNQIEGLSMQSIANPEEQSNNAGKIQELRTAIDQKEALILELKLNISSF